MTNVVNCLSLLEEKKTHKLIDAEKQRKPDGTYGDGRSDPITQIFGPEHGGRTRAISSLIGRTHAWGYFNVGRKRVVANLEDDLSREIQNTDVVLGFCGSSCDSGGSHIIYPDIENLCRCELLWSFDSRTAELTLANGRAFPTCDRYFDDILMQEHCVKILNTSSHSASRQSQILPQTSTCDIRTSAEGYIPELTTSGINSVQKSQSRQPMPKQTRVRQNKAKAKGKQAGGKLTYQELQAKNVDKALEKMKTRPRWHQIIDYKITLGTIGFLKCTIQ